MKNAFYFTLKALFILKIFTFLSRRFCYAEKRLGQKDRVNSKICGVTNLETVTINILPEISRSRGNQTMKFGQLIKYNLSSIFLKNMVEKLVSDPFLKIKLNISLDHQPNVLLCSKVLQFGFIVCQVEDYQNILKLSCRPLAFTSYKAFKKQKEVQNQSLCLFFRVIFEEKYFSWYILLSDQITLSGCLYFLKYRTICVLLLFVNQAVTS